MANPKDETVDLDALDYTPTSAIVMLDAQLDTLRAQLAYRTRERDEERARFDAEESAHSRTIDERDAYKRAVEEVAQILGCEDERTSCHDHRECSRELASEAMARADALRGTLEEVARRAGLPATRERFDAVAAEAMRLVSAYVSEPARALLSALGAEVDHE